MKKIELLAPAGSYEALVAAVQNGANAIYLGGNAFSARAFATNFSREELKKAVYAKLDWYHTEYLMKIEEPQKGAMLGIGINYIRFAVEEPNLFRFLFQSGFAVENNLLEMIDSPELVPVISAMQKAIGMNIEQTKKVFLSISLFAHGYASIIANNSLEYDEELIKTHLERAYRGAILAVQEEMK